MNSHPIFPIVALTLAASVAVLLVGLLRIPLRRMVGAQAAYWLVPASALAVLLPPPEHSLGVDFIGVSDLISQAIIDAIVAWTGASESLNYAGIGPLLWASGAALMLALTVR